MNKIYVTRPSMPSLEEYCEEIKSLWDTRILTNMGEKHGELERKLKDYLQVKNVSLMVNGHMALELALQAMNLSGEVITTPFTFASTIHAIVRNGLTPVFCDINSDDYTIDVKQIEPLITNKTSAIVPVHVYGNICDVEKINQIADKHGLKVIYDAAHAFGEIYHGIPVGNFGDASMFSFHATKAFNTIEGGAVCYSDTNYGVDLYRLKNFGIRNQETVDFVGSNAKMNEFQAAMGICNLRHIAEEILKRKAVYERYSENLKDVKGIRVNQLKDEIEYNYSYYPILVDEVAYGKDRNFLFEKLMKHGIYSRKYFYPLANEYDCYADKYDVNDTPVAAHVSRRILTLPIYADLEMRDIDFICEIIMKSGAN